MAVQQHTHVLHHFYWSICSIMVRYSFALRGDPVDQDHEIRLEEHHVDLMQKLDQFTEHYLCDINANGEVPVLEPLGAGPPLPDSVAITKLMAESYPTMIPQKEVAQLIEELHGINFFGFTFSGKPQAADRYIARINSLKDGQISDRYRNALDHKKKRVETSKIAALTPEAQKANEEYAAKLMAKLDTLLKESKTGYFFGFEKPSSLDAHLVVFIARMLDIGRGDVLPASIRDYGDKAMSGAAWKHVMDGRTTSPLQKL